MVSNEDYWDIKTKKEINMNLIAALAGALIGAIAGFLVVKIYNRNKWWFKLCDFQLFLFENTASFGNLFFETSKTLSFGDLPFIFSLNAALLYDYLPFCTTFGKLN